MRRFVMNRWMIYSTCSIFAFCAVGAIAASPPTLGLDAMPPTDAADLGDEPFDDAVGIAGPRPRPA
jgi:hypothetical protein